MRFLPIEWLVQHPWVAVMIGGFTLVGMWTAFDKAGQRGWAVLVPIYNLLVLARVAGAPTWTVLLYFVPLLNVVVALAHLFGVAKRFGRSPLFGLGLFFFGFLFWPLLGLGNARYRLA